MNSMSMPSESKARTAQLFCVVSVIIGVLALAAHLAFEVSRADLGSDLGLADDRTQALLHFAGLPMAVVGIIAALCAMAFSPNWKLKFGSPLPGLIVNGAAILWWFAR
jgi:hypothetical protein